MKRIFLLADDDIDDTSLFCEALNEVDPTIVCYCTSDGKETVEILTDNAIDKPHIIFLDINMPGMNGWDTLKMLKRHENLKDIPVLMYSTSSHEREVNTALDLGALCFFTKPNDFAELKNILQVVSANIHGNLLEAIGHFNNIKSKKVFACSEDAGA